jgi:hypothetical protein
MLPNVDGIQFSWIVFLTDAVALARKPKGIMNMFAGLCTTSRAMGIEIKIQKFIFPESPAAAPHNLLLLLGKVCPTRSGTLEGISEHTRSIAGQGGVDLRGGRRGRGGPAGLTARPNAVKVRIEDRSAEGLGEEVSGVELPSDLVQRHRPILHELLHP